MVKQWDFSPPGKPPRRPRTSQTGRKDAMFSPSTKAILNGLRQGPSFLILTNNLGPSAMDKRHLDEQLARIAVMQATIANATSGGKEINALSDDVGYAPYTFSSVNRYYSGSNIQLVQSWQDNGMETLLPFRIFAPTLQEEQPRQAILYAVGDRSSCERLEKAFLDFYDPYPYAASFCEKPIGDDNGYEATEFCVQWQLFPEEAAIALGMDPESPEFEQVMDQLWQMNQVSNGSHRQEQNVRKPSPNGVWPDLGKYKRGGSETLNTSETQLQMEEENKWEID